MLPIEKLGSMIQAPRSSALPSPIIRATKACSKISNRVRANVLSHFEFDYPKPDLEAGAVARESGLDRRQPIFWSASPR